MQLDMFGASEELAIRDAAPPVMSVDGAWLSPDALAFNAALKRGALKDAIAILNRLKAGVVAEVLLQSGFMIDSSTNRANLIAGAQKDILAAVRLRMTGAELRASQVAAYASNSIRPPTDVRIGDTVRKDGFDYIVTGPIVGGIAAERMVADLGSGVSESQTVFLMGNDAIDAKLEAEIHQLGLDGEVGIGGEGVVAAAQERVTPDLAANMKSGMRVVDGDGRQYEAFSSRFSYLEVHPLGVDGRPEVFGGNSVLFHLDSKTAEAYPERRHDAVFLVNNFSIDNSLEIAQNVVVDDAIITANEKESENDGRIERAEGVRSDGGNQDRVDGVNGSVDRESLENGLAGSGRGAVEGGAGNVSGLPGNASGQGEGYSGERGQSSAPVAARNFADVRGSGVAAGDVAVASGVVSAARTFTRAELSKLFVTDMTDEQLFQARDIYLEGGRASAIARQIAKRGIESPKVNDDLPYQAVRGADGLFTLENEEFVEAGSGDGSPRKFVSSEAATAWGAANGIEVVAGHVGPAVVSLPAVVNDAIASDVARQKARMMRLRTAAGAGHLTLVQKVKLQGNAHLAEAALRQMRQAVFGVEDDAVRAIEAGDVALFDQRMNMFPGVQAVLAEHIASLKEVEAAAAPVTVRQAWEIPVVQFWHHREANPFFDKSYPAGSGDAPYMKDAQDYHKEAVRDALHRGAAVPADVLASYPELAAVPAWHTQIPELGLPMIEAELGSLGYRDVVPRIAKEAVGAITQLQKMGGAALYAYVLPARDGLNGRVRLVAEDQAAPKGWSLLDNAAYRPSMLSDDQIIARLSKELMHSPVIGVKQEVQENSLQKSTSAGKDDFTPQDGWRESLLKARAYAMHLGIDTKDKSTITLVEQIDTTLAGPIDITSTASAVAPVFVKAADRESFVSALRDGQTAELSDGKQVKLIENERHGWNYVYSYSDARGIWAEGAMPVVPGATFKRGKDDAIEAATNRLWSALVEKKQVSVADNVATDLVGNQQSAQASSLIVGDEIVPEPSQRAAIAKRYAEVLAEGRDGVSAVPVDFHFKFADGVIAKDAFSLKWIVNGLNDKSKKVFAEFTGTKLPKAQGAAWDALKAWGGVTAEQAAEVVARAEAARAAKQELARDTSAEDDAIAQRFRASSTDRTFVTGKDVVDRQIGEGHTEIRNISVTPIPKYVLVNSATDRFYPLDKVAKAYAEVALKRMGISSQSLALDVDSVVSVEQAAADEVEHARELRDAAARGQTVASEADLAHLFGVKQPVLGIDQAGHALTRDPNVSRFFSGAREQAVSGLGEKEDQGNGQSPALSAGLVGLGEVLGKPEIGRIESPVQTVMSVTGQVEAVGQVRADSVNTLETTAEQKIRAAFEMLPSVSLGVPYPIIVEHGGVTRKFMARQDALATRNNKAAIHLTRIGQGRLIQGDDVGYVVNHYKLTGKDALEKAGYPRYATEENLKQWKDNFPQITTGQVKPRDGNVSFVAQDAIDAFSLDDSKKAFSIMEKLKLDDLKVVGAAIGFRPQNGENAKAYRERIAPVVDQLTSTNRTQAAQENKLYDRLMGLAMEYDRAINHRDRALANNVAPGSSAFEGSYEGEWTTIDKGLEILVKAFQNASASPDFAKVAEFVRSKRPALFEASEVQTAAQINVDTQRAIEGGKPVAVSASDVAVASIAPNVDYVLTDADRIGMGGLAEKFQDNLRAIQVLRTIDAEKRHAVGDELRSLARYVGWGGLKGVFDPENKQWNRQHVALRGLLSDAEWAAASRSQLDAHYTAPLVAKAMYSAVTRLGFKSGRVLEPSVGVGTFFGLMPEAMRQNSALHGVELDILTSQIVSALYPSAKISKATGFQEYNVPSGYFDMAIGNPPFGSQAISDDKGSAYSGWSIHNYFFAKSIDMLRPGGIMPMVVSHNFLDKLDPHVRQWIARRAALVSGVRLPNTAFKENANTEVVTDVLIFRRLDNENMLGRQELPDWLDTTDVMIENPKTGESEAVAINNYFINNAQNVLGTNSTAGSMYRANEYTVLPNGDLEQQLAQWVETLPQGVYVPLERDVVDLELAAVSVDVPEFVKEGSFFLSVGAVWQRLPDQLGERRAVQWEPANQKAMERMVGLINIRDALRGQMRLERSVDAEDVAVDAGRGALNRVYDAFQAKHGFVNDPLNRRLFLDDTESALVQALEFNYEKAIPVSKAEEYGVDPRPARAVKADIFSRRVLFPPVEVEIVETAKDALLHSLNISGRVDMAYMVGAYGKSQEAIIAELGDLLFVDPVLGLVTSDEYLSGDVKTKLAEAVKAAENDVSLSRNVDALKGVIPADKMPSEIHAAMGAAWIPPEIFVAFAKEVSGADATFNYVVATAQWLSSATTGVDYVKNNTEYGTNKLGALEILVQTMNSRGLEVKKKVEVDGSDRYVTDEEATEAVRQRSDKMRGHWDSWLWADGGRADKLMSIYNDRFNRSIERKYDGAHLTFPGMNPAITLLSHQKNGVWRGLQDRDMLMDQVVGAGKTYESVAMIMEMRRLGIAKKPIVAVPNHLTLQWRSDFYRLYPGANVLAATPQDFEKDNRERFFSKIVTGNWDAVIVGHSSLKKIAVPLEAETKIIKEQFDDIASAVADMKRERGDRNVIRDMEKIKANLEAKLTRLKESGGKKDNVVDFSDLGVDALLIDEMHEFKNLTFTTQMNRVSGLGNPAGSGKAFDLFVKVRWLKETFGDKAPLITATGTPISNSLAEMFTMQRYMQYDKLKANGLHVFDAWAKQYGDVQNVYEVAPSGTGYRLSQRFAKFKNLPSLMGEYRSLADVITLDDLKAQEAALGNTFPVPKLAGGRPLNVVASRSKLQEKFFGIPEIVRDEDGKIKFEIDLNFPITIGPREDGKFVMTQDMGKNYVTTSKAYDTHEEAEYMTALGATTPRMTVDPKSIVGQFENLRELTRSTKGKINALSLTGLANKAGLDYRLINPGAVDFAESKVNLAVRNMLVTAKKWDKDKGVQLVFCDLSVPLSAKAKMASKEKRVYVRDDKGGVTHKKGTLHTIKDYEGLPYYLVAVGKGNEKTFSMYDPVTGELMKNGLDSKQDAHMFAVNFMAKEGGQERWLDLREKSLPIGADEIDEYKNEHAIDADGDAADLEISAQDVEGASGVAGFSIYDDMKAKLIAGGVPAAQIEFIHDHDTPQAKDALFKRVNSGDVRFLFGSTPKMGAGTNVQQRLVALHHIDAPWRPSDLEQREGRIIRRGNLLYERDPVGFEIEVNRYATAQTYDTRRWQLLEHKAAGLEQLRNYDGANEIDDVANEASNSADMKAAASGNPLILKETQLSNEVKKLRMLERAHRDGEYSIRSRMNSNKYYAETSGPEELSELCGLQAQRDGAAVLGVYDGKSLVDKEAVLEALEKIGNAVAVSADVKTLVYRGIKIEFQQGFLDANISMSTPDRHLYHMDKLSPSGVVTRLENWCAGVEGKIASCERRIVVHKDEADKMAGQMGKSFDRADDLLASIDEHGKVQRALMKSNSMAAVKPEEMAAFQAAVDGQKAILRSLGLGRVVSEIEGEGLADSGIVDGKDNGQSQSQSPARGAGLDGLVEDMGEFIKVAANSVGELRKVDVFRVLVESNRSEHREAIAAYIKDARPDLVAEVDDVMEEARAELRQKSDVTHLPQVESVTELKAATFSVDDDLKISAINALRKGDTCIQDFMDAVGLTDDDVGMFSGNSLRDQAERGAKENSAYHCGIAKISAAIQALRGDLNHGFTPQTRKAFIENSAKYDQADSTLQIIAQNFENPFNNSLLSKLPSVLKYRYEKQWESIACGADAKRAFQDDSYQAWVELVIGAADKLCVGGGNVAGVRMVATEVSVPPEDVCIVTSGLHIGRVLEVVTGFAVQKTGRFETDVVAHALTVLDRVPVKGEMVKIGYAGGRGVVLEGVGQEQGEIGNGR